MPWPFMPFPATYFEYDRERFKVLRAKVVEAEGTPGKILEGQSALIIACGHKALEILDIQRQTKKLMPTNELLRGFEFKKDIIL